MSKDWNEYLLVFEKGWIKSNLRNQNRRIVVE